MIQFSEDKTESLFGRRTFVAREDGRTVGVGTLTLIGRTVTITADKADKPSAKDFLLRGLLNVLADCRGLSVTLSRDTAEFFGDYAYLSGFGFTKTLGGAYEVNAENITLKGACKHT